MGLFGYESLKNVNDISKSEWQNTALPSFMTQSSNLLNQVNSAQTPNFASQMGASQDLLSYFQNVAKGTQLTAADSMLQAAQQQQAAQAQSQVLAARGGMSSPLAMRQIGNMSQQAAGNTAQALSTQKMQEQFAGAGAAQGLIGQQADLQQMGFGNILARVAAAQNINQSMFGAGMGQAQLNLQGAVQNQQAQLTQRGQQAQVNQGALALGGSIVGGLLSGAAGGMAAK